MSGFQSFSTSGLSNSGIEDPACGGSPGADIWFQTTIPATGYINIVTLSNGMVDGAMAIYTGTCNNLTEFACADSDNCGNSIMPIWDWGNLAPGTTIFIRIWAESGGDGSFDIQITDVFSQSTPIDLIPTGDAFALGTDCIQLTTTGLSQQGCAWSPNMVDFSQPFSNNIIMNFGTNNGGADGICMVYHLDPAGMAACGIGGGQIGSGGIQNSFIIEFDTWDNGAAVDDIPNDHVSVDVNGDMLNAINGPFDLGNIEDGNDYEVLFTWDPSTNFYEIYFDGNLVLSGNYDIINNCFNGNSMAWCGFTGSTGGASNNQTVCVPTEDEYPSGDQSLVEVEICEGDSYFAGGANQTTSGTYFDNYLAYNGCDSVITTVLTVTPAIQVTDDVSICDGDSYFAGGANQTTSGTYIDLFTTPAGCDSIVTTNLTVNPNVEVSENVNICDGDSYFAGGANQTTSGTYMDTFLAANGCDSIVTTILTVDPSIEQTENVSICDGDSYFAGGANQTASGTYMDTFLAANGCDSTVTTILTVNPNIEQTENVAICDGDTYFAGGANQTTSGTYTDVFLSAAGCDSTVITNITVNPNVETTLFETICDGESLFVGGANQTTSGAYTDVFLSAAGCDSTVITNLTVNPNIEVTVDQEICEGESFFVGGASQTTGGAYTDIYVAANGCDSTVITNLTVNPDIEVTVDQEICEGEVFFAGGDFQTTGGTYTDTYTAANGCDSTVITQLTVHPDVVTVLNETICEGDCYFVDGIPFCSTGFHEVVLTSYQNCDSTVQLNLTVVSPEADIADPLIITCENPTITLDGSNSDSGPGITYLWTASDLDCFEGNITNSTVEVSCPDIYTLLVFQDIGGQQCLGMQEVVVQEYTIPPNVVIDPPGELNCSDPCTTISASQSDNGPPFVPTWTNQNGVVSNDLNPTVCLPGTYTLTIVNEDNGCSASASVDIQLDGTASFADAGPDGLLDCQNDTYTLDGSNSSVGQDYVLEWTDINNNFISNNPVITVNTAGSYILSVSNQGNGCNSADTVLVSFDMEIPEAVISGIEILDCATQIITLDGTNSLPASDYSFSWQSPLGVELVTTDTLDLDTPGTYFLVVNNTINGCSDTTSAIVNQNIIDPVADPGPDLTIDCAVSSVTFDGTGSSGNGPLGFQWLNEGNTNIGNTSSQEANAPGNYTLIVTDMENHCVDTATVMLTSSSIYPVAEAGTDTLINCSNPSINLSAEGSDSGPEYTYEWQDENGNPVGMDSLVEVSNTGQYQLLVTNTDNGCTSSDVVNVGEDFIAPLADAGPDQILDCISNSVTLDAANSQQGPSISYSWEDGNNNPVGIGQMITVNSADTYTLVVTDHSNGCSANASTEVTQQTDAPVADAGMDMVLNCFITEVTLDGSNSTFGPDIEAEWTNAVGDSIGNSAQIQTTLPGTYSLSLLDTSNGCTSLSNVVVSIDTISPNLPQLDHVILNCLLPETTLGASLAEDNPTWNFAWTNSVNTLVGDTDTLAVSAADIYTLYVRDANNFCSDEISVTVLEDFITPLADAGADETLDCVTASITLDGSNSDQGGNFEYEWFDGSNNSISNNITADVNMPDTYTLVVTNTDNGCNDNASVIIDQEMDAPTADAGPDLIINCNETMVTLDGNNSSTGPDITSSWADMGGNIIGNSLQIQVADPGTYTLSITDNSNGCISVSNALVEIDTIAPSVDPLFDVILNCYAPQTTLGITMGNANPDLSFNWTDDQGNILANTDTLFVDNQGIFTLTVSSIQNFCQTSVSATVTEDYQQPQVMAGNDSTLTCNTTSIMLDANGSDTGPEFELTWQNSLNETIEQGADLMVSVPDIYTLSVLNSVNGCMASDQVTISIDTLSPVADAGQGGILTCVVQDIDLNATSSVFGNNPSFSWTDENGMEISTSLMHNVSLPGIYNINITNLENGCEDSDMVSVLQNITPPVADAGQDFELNCYSPNTILDGSNSSSGTNFTYEWQDDNMIILGNENMLSVSTSQNYTLVVTDTENGCVSNDAVTVSEDFEAPTADAGTDIILDCQTTDFDLGGAGTSIGPGMVYEWFNELGTSIGSGINHNVEEAGSFTLTVFNNDNGCSDTSSVNVMVDQEYPLITGSVDEMLTCVQLTAILDATGSSEGIEFVYDWSAITGGVISPGQDDLTPFVSAPGTYQLIITNNENQCAVSTEFTVLQDITPPTADAGQGFELNCHAPVSNLNGNLSSPAGLLEYSWSTTTGQFESNTDIPQPTISFPGDYLLTVINTQNGCTDNDLVTITSNFITEMEIETEHPLCFGETGSLVVPSITGGVPPFLYSVDGGETFGQSSVFTNLVAGQYDVVIMDSNDCLLEETSQVIAPDELLLTLDSDVTILLGDDYQFFTLTNLPPSQIDTIIWTPSESLDCADCLDPVATPFETTQYAVEVVDTNGCNAIAFQSIIVDKRSNVFIPNVFSPNGDGNNDIFTIFSDLKSVERVLSFQIYNRWGEVVFEAYDFPTNDPAYGWNGLFRGKLLNPAVFVYQAQIRYIDGREELFKGDVTLMR